MEIERLSSGSGPGAIGHDGRVRVELWLRRKDDSSTADPFHVEMTPGQALNLISRLSSAVQTCLSNSVK